MSFLSNVADIFIAGRSGLLIPVRTADGLIQGLQIRLDGARAKRKYRWLSSGGLNGGTESEAFIHVTGDRYRNTVYVTEGPLKGDAASLLSGDALFVCVPGVNVSRGLFETLSALGAKNIALAFDADRLINPNVKRAAESTAAYLRRAFGARVTVKSWDAACKGIDDYCLSLRESAA